METGTAVIPLFDWLTADWIVYTHHYSATVAALWLLIVGFSYSYIGITYWILDKESFSLRKVFVILGASIMLVGGLFYVFGIYLAGPGFPIAVVYGIIAVIQMFRSKDEIPIDKPGEV